MENYSVIDLFCGVGGLTHGFVLEKFNVIAGIDSDPSCKYAYEKNNATKFIEENVAELSGRDVAKLYPDGEIKVLIGCAPCQPFSTYTNKLKEKNQKQWSLLDSFGRIIAKVQPEIISMENVPSLGSKQIFKDFVDLLVTNDYHVTWSNIYCPDYGVPQQRTRLVLLASKYEKIHLIEPTHEPEKYLTVQETIGHLPAIEAGEIYDDDTLHRSSRMSPLNLERIKNSKPGGTWEDWAESLVAPCHKKDSGSSYYNVYGRMEWGDVSPTITTQFTGFGNGRFGHPEQNRALSLREGALLQTFPPYYEFIDPDSEYKITYITKYIGNAVPVQLARVIAKSIRQHLEEHCK